MEQSEILRKLIEIPDADLDYAKLFAKTFENILFWTVRKPTFMYYNGNVWKAVTIEEVKKCMANTLVGVLERLIYVFNEQRRHLDLDETADKKAKKEAERCCKNALTGLKYVKRDRNLRGIIELVKSQLVHPEFNRVPWTGHGQSQAGCWPMRQ